MGADEDIENVERLPPELREAEQRDAERRAAPRANVVHEAIVGMGGFAHVIAGSVETLFLVVSGGVAWSSYLGGFLIPTLLGNIVGGVSLVAALNHAQTVAG